LRLLGVDFGGARIGRAVAESEFRVASPRKPLAASGKLSTDAAALAELARNEEAELVVVGVPLVDEAETKMSRVCRKLGEEIRSRGLRVEFCDESWTSQEAEAVMRDAGLKGSQVRKSSDGEAACRILERYLAAHGP
jgi:putative Holliday junction resolvase